LEIQEKSDFLLATLMPKNDKSFKLKIFNSLIKPKNSLNAKSSRIWTGNLNKFRILDKIYASTTFTILI
jgi:hypothetical protein